LSFRVGKGFPNTFPARGKGTGRKRRPGSTDCVCVLSEAPPPTSVGFLTAHGLRCCYRCVLDKPPEVGAVAKGIRPRQLGLMRLAPDNTHTRTTSRKPTVRRSRTKHRGVSRRRQRTLGTSPSSRRRHNVTKPNRKPLRGQREHQATRRHICQRYARLKPSERMDDELTMRRASSRCRHLTNRLNDQAHIFVPSQRTAKWLS